MSEITYTMVGDYNLPNLKLPEQTEVTLGRWSQMRRTYLKEHHKILYYDIINFSIFIPQPTVQIKPYELSFIIANQRHRVRKGISCANVSADLRLQGMKIGVDLLHIMESMVSSFSSPL